MKEDTVTPMTANDANEIEENLAKSRFAKEYSKLSSLPNVNVDQVTSRCVASTLVDILVASGITTKAKYYNLLSFHMENKVEDLAEKLGVEFDEEETNAEDELTA